MKLRQIAAFFLTGTCAVLSAHSALPVTAQHEIVFIDAAIPDPACIAAAVRPGVELVMLDPRGDELAQIENCLAQRHGLTALHLVSHGAPGALFLGSACLDTAALARESARLAVWHSALAPEAQVLLYGCNVAQGAVGGHFLGELARLTGARVAASVNPTGAAALGGDWRLECHSSGALPAHSLLAEKLAGYRHLLVASPIVNGLFGDTLSYTEHQDQSVTPALVDVGGNATISSANGWNNGSLKVEFTVGDTAEEDSFYFGNSGTGPGQIQPGYQLISGSTYGNVVKYGGTVIGTWQASGGYNDTPILITFNASATNAVVTALVNNLHYSNSAQFAPSTASRTVHFTFIDSASRSTTADTTITVTAVNDAPKFIGAGFTATDVGIAAGNYGDGQAIAQQSDGKYVAVLTIGDKDGNSQVAVARYNNDGTLDTTFGTSGFYLTALGVNASPSSTAKGIVIRTDAGQEDKIVIAFTDKTVVTLDPWVADDSIVLLQLTSAGALDTTFGSSGICRFNIGATGSLEEVLGLAQQSDGKFLAVGSLYRDADSNRNIALWRFTANGVLDTGFAGGTGYACTLISNSYSYGYEVLVQPNGKILVGGAVHGANNTTDPWDLGVRRYNTDGTLDTSFGTSGMAQLDYADTNDAYAHIARQTVGANAGKIIVVGNYTIDPAASSPTSNLTVARLNADGTLDTTFGTSGWTVLDVANNKDDNPNGLTLDASDNIVIAGSMGGTAAVVRLTANGALDTTFNGTGKLLLPQLGEYPAFNSVRTDAAGKLVLIGSVQDAEINPLTLSSNQYPMLARLNPDGTLDTMGSQHYTQGGAAVVLDADVQVYDGELAAVANYTGASLTLARHGGASTDDSFSGSGTLSFSGGNVVVGGITLGTYTQSGGTLTITYGANATTNALVTSSLRQLAYANTSGSPPASMQIDWLFSDGNSGAQGTGGVKTVAASTTVTLSLSPPTVTGISPTSGPTAGGTSVIITGTNLTGATAVMFGATPATGYTVNGSTQITATAPAGSAGTVDITVTTGGGTSATNADDRFTYTTNNAPVLDATKSPAFTAINQTDTADPSGAVGTLVSALVSLSGGVANVTDSDASPVTGLALTATNTTNGTWYYSTNGGTDWNLLGAVSNTSALLLKADANTRLYFKANGTFSGTITDAITFRAWDQFSGTAGSTATTATNGGSSAFSTATDTASLTVVDNVAPTVVSVVRKTPATQRTNSSTVVFTVTYSEPVTNVTTDQFSVEAVNGSGVTGSVTNVAGSGATRDVTVSLGSTNGEFRLKVLN